MPVAERESAPPVRRTDAPLPRFGVTRAPPARLVNIIGCGRNAVFERETTSGVSRLVSLECVDGHGQAMTLEGVLGYDRRDPFAVRVIFPSPSGDVVWMFARDLLIDGLEGPAGSGDVHIWPCLSGARREVLIIELSSPDGELLVQTSAREVRAFVQLTLAAVPRGTESATCDVDGLLTALLA